MFDLVEFIGATRVPPLDGCSQSSTAQEVVVGMTSVRPPRRGRGDMVVQAAAVDVLRQPVGEARPSPQQRVVGDLDGFAVEHQQPAIDERPERIRRGGMVGWRDILWSSAEPGLAAGPVDGSDQSEQDPTRRRLDIRGHRRPRVLGQAGDGAGDAAGQGVAGQGELVASAPLPGFRQRRRHQRERPERVRGIGDDLVGQRPFDRQSGARRRALDDLSDLGAGRRADERGGVSQPGGDAPGVRPSFRGDPNERRSRPSRSWSRPVGPARRGTRAGRRRHARA